MQNSIFVKTSFVGFHAWPGAPDQVAFLRNLHRHVFHVRVEVEVKHDDREIEFFIFKRDVDSIIREHVQPKLKERSQMSCEMLSDCLHSFLTIKYPARDMVIEISEDDENGCRKTYSK